MAKRPERANRPKRKYNLFDEEFGDQPAQPQHIPGIDAETAKRIRIRKEIVDLPFESKLEVIRREAVSDEEYDQLTASLLRLEPAIQTADNEAAKKALAAEVGKAAEAAKKKKSLEAKTPAAAAPKIDSDQIKEVLNGNQQSPTVTNGNQQSPTVTRKAYDAKLTVTNGNPLTVINGNQKKWRDCFCLILKFFCDTQPNNIALKTTNHEIEIATGLSYGTVKNALSALSSLGFVENLGGKSGRYRPQILRQITPLGFALMATDFFREKIEQQTFLTVTNSNQRSPVNGNQRSPRLTDGRILLNQSVCQSGEWQQVLDASHRESLMPAISPERIASLVAAMPHLTPEHLLEQLRVWAYKYRIDKAWARKVKRQWPVFETDMIKNGAIDPNPGYRSKAEQAVKVADQEETTEQDPEAEQARAEFKAFALTAKGEAFVQSCQERGVDAFVAWNMERLKAIFDKPRPPDLT